MTGLRPIHLVRQTVSGTRNTFAKMRDWRLHRQLRKSDLKGQLEIHQREKAKEQRAVEKRLKKMGAPVSENSTPLLPEELTNRPKPKVVDTTAWSSELAAARRKPSLAELRASGEKTKASS